MMTDFVLPSLSLVESGNPSLAHDAWGVLSLMPYETRYRMYVDEPAYLLLVFCLLTSVRTSCVCLYIMRNLSEHTHTHTHTHTRRHNTTHRRFTLGVLLCFSSAKNGMSLIPYHMSLLLSRHPIHVNPVVVKVRRVEESSRCDDVTPAVDLRAETS